MAKRNLLIVISYLFLVLLVLVDSCSTGVESSPEPGILRVKIQSDSSDTSIVIANKTYILSKQDRFNVKFTQGKVYDVDSVFFTLYPDIFSYTQRDVTCDILKTEDGQYKEFTIFETFLPPGEYRRLQFGIAVSSYVFLGNNEIPISLPPNTELLIDFDFDFSINSNELTEIKMNIYPFQSIKRFQDSFYFIRKVEVVKIDYTG
ncbi:MAG: hypothetical protein DRP89_03595 [Candidatus Neomarinimicrobiota bacterium]|nr:MAG: hypothetical protein DRP89_03595 [Candidatus Neomarinimicrobiota bacterium]